MKGLCLYRRLIITALVFTTLSARALSTVKFEGRAYKSSKKLQLIYIEKHTQTYEEQKIQSSKTEYFNSQNKKIALLSCDYRKSIFTPDCNFDDFQFGHQEMTELQEKSNNYTINYRKSKNDPVKSVKVQISAQSSASQGLLQYIVMLMKKKMKKKKKKTSDITSFILPTKEQAINLKISIKKISANIKQYYVKVAVNNLFLRMFAPHIEMNFDSTYKLLNYLGNSNIPTSEGENQSVFIEYDYGE